MQHWLRTSCIDFWLPQVYTTIHWFWKSQAKSTLVHYQWHSLFKKYARPLLWQFTLLLVAFDSVWKSQQRQQLSHRHTTFILPCTGGQLKLEIFHQQTFCSGAALLHTQKECPQLPKSTTKEPGSDGNHKEVLKSPRVPVGNEGLDAYSPSRHNCSALNSITYWICRVLPSLCHPTAQSKDVNGHLVWIRSRKPPEHQPVVLTQLRVPGPTKISLSPPSKCSGSACQLLEAHSHLTTRQNGAACWCVYCRQKVQNDPKAC